MSIFGGILKKTKPPAEPRPYHEMLVPFASKDEMDKALNAFMDDVKVAREKHRIADVAVCAEAPAMTDHGNASFFMTVHLGHHAGAIPMVAQWLGRLRGQQDMAVAVLRGAPRTLND